MEAKDNTLKVSGARNSGAPFADPEAYSHIPLRLVLSRAWFTSVNLLSLD